MLAWRQRGHTVTVYGRDHWVPRRYRSYRGMRIVRLPAPRSKYLETVTHTLFSAFHALRDGHDLLYLCNSANVPSAALLRAAGRRVVLNVDGLEWERTKWGTLGRAYYRACAWSAARLPVEVVTDARVIQDHYRQAFGRETQYFAYGTDLEAVEDDGTLAGFGLEAGCYILYVSRLEPENNAHVVVEAFAGVTTELPLVIVGDAAYSPDYLERLRSAADPRVIFTGGVYGRRYRVLVSNAAAYVQATEVGGTHPALVEAMGHGNAIVANDVAAHREVLGDAGLYYTGAAGLRDALQAVSSTIAAAARGLRRRGAGPERGPSYSWDLIATAYERWFEDLLAPR